MMISTGGGRSDRRTVTGKDETPSCWKDRLCVQHMDAVESGASSAPTQANKAGRALHTLETCPPTAWACKIISAWVLLGWPCVHVALAEDSKSFSGAAISKVLT